MIREPFSDRRHLQFVVRRELNREIREHFRDLFGENDTWEPEINTTRGQMLRALLHEESDTIEMTNTRMMLYYFTFGQAQALQTPVYGMPITTFNETTRYRPQIELFFSEDLDDVAEGFRPIRAEINFTLIEEDEESITPAKARTYANRINTLFASGNGFRWKKGKEIWVYIDPRRGYQLHIYSWDEAEAKKVIERILDIQNHVPEWNKYLTEATRRKDLRTTSPIPPTKRVYGQNRRLPRRLPVGYVRFKYASLKVWGLRYPEVLVDRTGLKRNPLVSI